MATDPIKWRKEAIEDIGQATKTYIDANTTFDREIFDKTKDTIINDKFLKAVESPVYAPRTYTHGSVTVSGMKMDMVATSIPPPGTVTVTHRAIPVSSGETVSYIEKTETGGNDKPLTELIGDLVDYYKSVSPELLIEIFVGRGFTVSDITKALKELGIKLEISLKPDL